MFHEYAHDESKPFEGALLHWYPKACADAGGPEALERAFIRYCLSDFAEGLTQPGSARVFMRPDVWVKDIAPRMARRCSCPRSHFELQLGGREEPTHRPECPAGDAERVEVSVAKLVSWLQAGEVAA